MATVPIHADGQSKRREDFPLDSFRYLESRLQEIRKRVMDLAAEIVLLQFTITTWDGSEAIDIETMRVHYIGDDQEVYLTLSTLTPNTPSATNFGADEIPNNNPGNMWDEGNNLFWLDDENVLWIQIDLTNLNGIGDMLDPNEKVTVTFIPAHGPVVAEEFVTPTNFGGARYIDLTST